MDKIKNHVRHILNQSNFSDEEKKDLAFQFKDHINSSKEDYINKGVAKNKAISLAIRDFGDENSLAIELNSKTSLKSGAKRIILMIFFVYMFILLGHYLKLAFDFSSIRFKLYNLIPLVYITHLIKDVFRYGFNINNLDYIITYGLAFIPVGVLIPFINNQLNSFRNNLKVYIILASGILIIRFIFAPGVVFIDHGIMHLTGCVAGYFIYKSVIVQPKMKRILFD
jgi:hypothetical protein